MLTTLSRMAAPDAHTPPHPFPAELAALVAHFSSQQPYFTGPDYNEAKLREDFLNPFFADLHTATNTAACDLNPLLYQLCGLTPKETALVESTST
jgi:hypothetical protein